MAKKMNIVEKRIYDIVKEWVYNYDLPVSDKEIKILTTSICEEIPPQ